MEKMNTNTIPKKKLIVVANGESNTMNIVNRNSKDKMCLVMNLVISMVEVIMKYLEIKMLKRDILNIINWN